jgi:hypothetical protein
MKPNQKKVLVMEKCWMSDETLIHAGELMMGNGCADARSVNSFSWEKRRRDEVGRGKEEFHNSFLLFDE